MGLRRKWRVRKGERARAKREAEARRRFDQDMVLWNQWQALRDYNLEGIVWVTEVRQWARTGTKGTFEHTNGWWSAFWAPGVRVEPGTWIVYGHITFRERTARYRHHHGEDFYEIGVALMAPAGAPEAWLRIEAVGRVRPP